MPQFTSSVHGARTSMAVALAIFLAVSAAGLTGCAEPAGPWPSTGPVDTLTIHTIPAGASRVLLRGQTLRMVGVPQDAAGRWVDVPVFWSSSNPQIATIDEHGVLLAVGNVNPTDVDTVTITATAAGHTATERVIVRRFPAVASVELSAVSPFLPVRALSQVTATPLDAAGAPIVGPTLEWRTTDADVATVSETGLVTRTGTGTAVISAVALEDGEEISGAMDISVAPVVTAGSFTAPDILDGQVMDWLYIVPAGVTSFRVNIDGPSVVTGGTGDADLYVFAPSAIPSSPAPPDGWLCRPALSGSVEECTITGVIAGAIYGVRVHALDGAGTVSDLEITITEPET